MYIHSKSRPQLLEYLGGGFQTVGYKFSDIPCPNSGNYVNFWIKLSSVSGRKQVEACKTNLVILYCKIWKVNFKWIWLLVNIYFGFVWTLYFWKDICNCIYFRKGQELILVPKL